MITKNVNMITTHIRISQENYKTLKKLASAKNSFNDVITAILEKINDLQQSTGVGTPFEIVVKPKQPSKEELPTKEEIVNE